VAEDRALGKEIENIAQDFAYGQGLTATALAKSTTYGCAGKEAGRRRRNHFNLKKGKGGLVDIEFLTQMLQLTRIALANCESAQPTSTEGTHERGILKRPNTDCFTMAICSCAA
jgi:glutamine synthetase adenylyltransferase